MVQIAKIIALVCFSTFLQCSTHGMKIAVIGAGPAGLCSAHFITKNFPDAEVVVFEATEELGGTWRYVEDPQDDEYGLSPMTAMYQNLRANLPKQLMAFSDFPMPETTPSFMTHDEYLKYIRSYASHFNLTRYIKLRHEVIEAYPEKSMWIVKYKNLKEEKIEEDIFDFVFVCNGHNSKFIIPKFEGQDLFKGIQIHSYHYRKPEDYANKNVLVIGAGPSGIDIAVDLIPKANAIFFSHHNKLKSPYHNYPNVIMKPDVGKFTNNSVVFQDGSIEEIDAVIYCTGYGYEYKFLDDRSGIDVIDKKLVHPLYQHIVNIENPTMFFIGLTHQVSIIIAIDIQVRYCLALIKGDFSLPLKDAMLEKTNDYYKYREIQKVKQPWSHGMMYNESNYYQELIDESGIQGYPNVLLKLKFHASMIRAANVFTYRNCVYTILDDENFTDSCNNV